MAVSLKKTEEQLTNEVMGKISLVKDQDKFRGNVVNLSKTIIDISQKADVDLGSTKAQVVVVVDYSGSMNRMYKDGTVQNVIDKLLPLGLTFDDNGEVEVFRFDSGFKQFPSLNIKNYEGYVAREIFNDRLGSTCYAPVLKEIKRQYIDKPKKGLFGLFSKKNESKADSSVNPVFVIFITDGDNQDKGDTNTIIRELSATNCFIQFIGVGKDNMSYLTKLDDLKGRECDNTGFERFQDIASVSDSELYYKVLVQYADWLKVKGF